jgi:hypothetical protein
MRSYAACSWPEEFNMRKGVGRHDTVLEWARKIGKYPFDYCIEDSRVNYLKQFDLGHDYRHHDPVFTSDEETTWLLHTTVSESGEAVLLPHSGKPRTPRRLYECMRDPVGLF